MVNAPRPETALRDLETAAFSHNFKSFGANQALTLESLASSSFTSSFLRFSAEI